ncbi:hypothetical protein F5I97DRAFT_117003 [Phlebopus sp. FC_14]|nr:hypothetical protein F5I97DRAFT_117003 [Phlebopus sp. FC_14]
MAQGEIPQRFPAHPLAGLRNFVQTQRRRTMGLPPLLTRGFVGRAHGDHDHDHNRTHHEHEHQKGESDHGHSREKAPRSVYAGPARRSSIFVSGSDGKKYVVSRAHSRQSLCRRMACTMKGKGSRRGHGRRQSNQVLGTIDVMEPGQAPGTGQRIASLVVDSSPTNSTSGQNNTESFPLSVSTTNQTQFLMALVDDANDSAGSSKHVVLAMPVFDAYMAQSVIYCATYDHSGPSALVMSPCQNLSSSSTDDSSTGASFANTGDFGNALDPHTSQLFLYDPASGQIQPSSVSRKDSTDDSDGTDANTPSLSAKHVGRADGSNTTTTSSGTVTSSTSTATAASPTSSQQAQNVTLVFVPAGLEVPVAAASSTPTETRSGVANEAAVTTTVTETVIATVTASSASATTSPAVAPATSGAPTTTATSPTPSSTQPAPLEVEVVPATLAATSSMTGSTATSSVTATSTTTLNAQAVASSIANASTPRGSASSTTSTTSATSR